MRRTLSILTAAAALSAANSCASRTQEQQPGFSVTARNFDVSPLVGEWKGQFFNVEMGRTGTIAFTLASREETAIGEIVLLSTNAKADTLRSGVATGAATPPARQVVQISFIRLEGDNVVGRTEAYVHPSCNCRVNSTFRGALRGGVIEGTYVVIGADDPSMRFTGNWSVTRVKRL